MKGNAAQIQTHSQQMLQTQALSPLQVLIARLLQLTTVEMEERVRGEIIENPALDGYICIHVYATKDTQEYLIWTYMSVHTSTIYDSQKLETIQMFLINKQVW